MTTAADAKPKAFARPGLKVNIAAAAKIRSATLV